MTGLPTCYRRSRVVAESRKTEDATLTGRFRNLPSFAGSLAGTIRSMTSLSSRTTSSDTGDGGDDDDVDANVVNVDVVNENGAVVTDNEDVVVVADERL